MHILYKYIVHRGLLPAATPPRLGQSTDTQRRRTGAASRDANSPLGECQRVRLTTQHGLQLVREAVVVFLQLLLVLLLVGFDERAVLLQRVQTPGRRSEPRGSVRRR